LAIFHHDFKIFAAKKIIKNIYSKSSEFIEFRNLSITLLLPVLFCKTDRLFLVLTRTAKYLSDYFYKKFISNICDFINYLSLLGVLLPDVDDKNIIKFAVCIFL